MKQDNPPKAPSLTPPLYTHYEMFRIYTVLLFKVCISLLLLEKFVGNLYLFRHCFISDHKISKHFLQQSLPIPYFSKLKLQQTYHVLQ